LVSALFFRFSPASHFASQASDLINQTAASPNAEHRAIELGNPIGDVLKARAHASSGYLARVREHEG
jgi:hypothetical protein